MGIFGNNFTNINEDAKDNDIYSSNVDNELSHLLKVTSQTHKFSKSWADTIYSNANNTYSIYKNAKSAMKHKIDEENDDIKSRKSTVVGLAHRDTQIDEKELKKGFDKLVSVFSSKDTLYDLDLIKDYIDKSIDESDAPDMYKKKYFDINNKQYENYTRERNKKK